MDHECRIDGLVISNLLLRLYKNPFFKTAALNLNPCFLGAGTGFDSLEAKITAVVVIILLLLFTILLLKSAISEQNPKFLLPWLVAKGISTILQVFVTPYVATLLYADKQTFLLYIFSSIIALGMLFLILHHLTVLRICICNVQMMKLCYFNIYSFAKLFLVGGVQLLQRINRSHQRATRRQHDWKIGLMLQLIKMRMLYFLLSCYQEFMRTHNFAIWCHWSIFLSS